MKCDHERTIIINAHSSDANSIEVPHLNFSKEGYLPYIDNLCGGDDMSAVICLDCGKVVGFDGIDDEALKEALEIDQDEDEDEDSDGDGFGY